MNPTSRFVRLKARLRRLAVVLLVPAGAVHATIPVEPIDRIDDIRARLLDQAEQWCQGDDGSHAQWFNFPNWPNWNNWNNWRNWQNWGNWLK